MIMGNIMDKQEITTFADLYIKFQKRCKHIASILSEYDCYFKESNGNNWELRRKSRPKQRTESKFDCYTDVDIIAPGWHVDSRSLHFPIELLSANDERIHEYASSKYKKA